MAVWKECPVKRGDKVFKVYATRRNGTEVLYGIRGVYHCTPQWYRIHVTKSGTYVNWRGRRHYIKLEEEL